MSALLPTFLPAWVILLFVATAASADPGPAVEAPWARATAPTASTGAAYLVVRGGDADDRLLSAATAVAERVELHTHAMADGMMQMRKLPDVAVPGGATVEFKPGGLHVMLFGLKAPLAAGSSFDLQLRFASGATRTVAVSVRGVGATGAEMLPPGKAHGHQH